MKDIKKISKIFLVTFLISIILLGIVILPFYPKLVIDASNIILEKNMKDFTISGDTVTSTSYDPFINLYLDKGMHIKTVSLYIERLSEEKISAEIFTINNSVSYWNSQHLYIKDGKNTVWFTPILDNITIDYIRLDLAEVPNVSMDIKYVIINEPFLLLKNICCIGIIFSCFVLFYYLAQRKRKDKTINELTYKIKSYINEYKFLLKPTGILFAIYSIGIISIIRANVKYIDDLGRIYSGSNVDWLVYQRYLEYFLSIVLNIGNRLVDISPISQLLGCFMTAMAGAILLYVITEQKKFTFSQYLAMISFGLSPYYLECLSYKFEAPYYGVAILFCIIPFLFYKKNNLLYYIISTASLLVMFNTYYAASGVYPMIVILLMYIMWLHRKDNKIISSFSGVSVGAYVSALGIYKFLIMKPVDSWVSSSLPNFNKLLPTIVNNYKAYCSFVLSDFKSIWLLLITIVVAGFLVTVSFRTKRNKVVSIVLGFLTIILIAALCWGLYPALESTSFACRAMFGFGIFITLVAVFVCLDDTINIFKIASGVLAWNFFIFSLSYGNYLSIQKDYTDFRIQNVLNYLTDLDYYSDTENTVYIEIVGSIGYSPVINNIPYREMKIIKRLIPITFCGQWSWGDYEFYNYYNLTGYSWQIGEGNDKLMDLKLPCIDNTMYFDVYGDKEHLLIELK